MNVSGPSGAVSGGSSLTASSNTSISKGSSLAKIDDDNVFNIEENSATLASNKVNNSNPFNIEENSATLASNKVSDDNAFNIEENSATLANNDQDWLFGETGASIANAKDSGGWLFGETGASIASDDPHTSWLAPVQKAA